MTFDQAITIMTGEALPFRDHIKASCARAIYQAVRDKIERDWPDFIPDAHAIALDIVCVWANSVDERGSASQQCLAIWQREQSGYE